MPARGGDAYPRAQAFDSLPHAFDAFQFALERSRESRAKNRHEKFSGNGAPSSVSIPRGTNRADAQEAFARFLIGQAKAGFAQPAAHDAERDHFAVDQHAVAIENDQFRPARLAIEFANLPLGPAQHLEGPALSRVERRDRSAGGRRRVWRERRHRRHADAIVCVPAATAPSIAEPSSTGSGVSGDSTVLPHTSAMIWRTNALRAAPPLTTIESNS